MLSRSAFRKIYDLYRKPVARFVSARIHDDEIAEELTQEVFFKIYKSRETYDPKQSFTSWMWTIARNTVFDHLRSRKDAAAEEASPPEDLQCTRDNAEALVFKKDQLKRLFRAARSLTRLQRRVLWFRLVHHLSFAEIAHRLGMSLTAVKNVAYRAKQALGETGALIPAFA